MASSDKQFDAFLSHSSKDRTYAEMVCQSLESHSLRCWIAPRDIQPGAEWGAAIIDGIENSKVMLVIFSSHANESAQVRREVERAIGKSMPILPFRIEDANPKGALEFALSNTHWLDGFKPPIEPSLNQLVHSVKALCSVAKSFDGSEKSIDGASQDIDKEIKRAESFISEDVSKATKKASLPNEAPLSPLPNQDSHRAGESRAGSTTTNATESMGGDRAWMEDDKQVASTRNSHRTLWMTLVLGLAVLLGVGFWMVNQPDSDEEETGEPALVGKQPSGLSKEAFQKRELKKFLGRWVAVQESTPEGKFPQKAVSARAFTITVRPNLAAHRRNPKLNETVMIRGDIQFEEGSEFDKFVFTGLDQDKVKQTFIGIYDFDGKIWRWCFRRSDAPGKLQAPLQMNTAGERNTYYVALAQVDDKGD